MPLLKNKKYKITPRALNDFKKIGRYTERAWSKVQRNKYLKELEARFQWLADSPLVGKNRADICDNYYSFPQGQHVIFYLIENNFIYVIGIPHKDMDIISYFLVN